MLVYVFQFLVSRDSTINTSLSRRQLEERWSMRPLPTLLLPCLCSPATPTAWTLGTGESQRAVFCSLIGWEREASRYRPRFENESIQPSTQVPRLYVNLMTSQNKIQPEQKREDPGNEVATRTRSQALTWHFTLARERKRRTRDYYVLETTVSTTISFLK